MPDHTVKAFTEELEAVAKEVERMGGLAEASVNDAIAAVGRRDSALAQAVIARDPKIDAAQREVERRAVKLFALRQPMAMDLREVLAAWRIASDLERVGDLAKNIGKRALVLNQGDPHSLIKSIERMGKITAAQLRQVLDAYGKKDVRSAVSVWFQDEDIDAHYNSLFRELVTYMMEDPRMIGAGAHLMFIAKNIERIGDHATNIAETVHYLVTGEQIATERPKADTTSLGIDD
ncbi:MAG: phosphate signaling complex protein PhoU [Caulobacterales bacterium]